MLEQRHWDLVGLALVAFAAFFACVFYLSWAGGEVGEALSNAILFCFGGVGYLAPVALFAAGALLVVRPMMGLVHPFRTGAVCLLAALTLGLAAGSLGLGPGDTPREGFLDPVYLRSHGGLVGESLLWVSSTLFSKAGSHILFVFLMLAAILLLTGASIAGMVRAGQQAATTTGDRMRRTANSLNLPTEATRPAGPLPGDPIPGKSIARTRTSSLPSPRARSRWCAPPTSRRRPSMPPSATPTSIPRTRWRTPNSTRSIRPTIPPSRCPGPTTSPRSRRSSPRWATAARRLPRPTTWSTACPSRRFSLAPTAPRRWTRRASRGWAPS